MFRRRPPAGWLLVGAASVLLSGCGLFEDQAASTSTTKGPTTTTTTPRPSAEPEVLDPGASPRRAIRLQLVQGAKATVALTVDLNVTQQSVGFDQALNGPPVTETVVFTVARCKPTQQRCRSGLPMSPWIAPGVG